ncbi:NADP-dependent succinic semialdehyde dehydrogenase [Homoserinimonas hongtaonis]|uniref:NADP-dependent succinic semialdehyde dehydrogenase n=1 Tax=Homoserinimonas hongtaonis TaxID=2079791 RepID=UPI000D3402D1|nr:NADP-dependent succinic semialdehyde dehydrogenase [Salinibacterium hongtaonis]AWB90320.1 NADP-dependent succinic semialdehyde dehydrogenase [Salinibacterium hongtaonis]
MAICTINPTTGRIEAEFAAHDAAETSRRITESAAAFAALGETCFDERAEWMRAAASLLEAESEATARLLTSEMGKPISQARAEVLKCARALRFYADNASTFLADEPVADPAIVAAQRAVVTYRPLGVILAVMPWNFPLWQAIRFAAPALMAGNTALLKHSSNVPQTALYLDALFERSGFPSGSFRVLFIGAGDVESVIRDARVKAVTLTGSEGAGRAVAAIAGSEVKKSVIELGGSDPFIVMPSADVEAASSIAVKARFSNTGQSCVCAKRFIVHTDIYDEFTRLFVEKTRALNVGDPMDESVEIGPLATEQAREDIAALVDDAIAKGASLLAGGHRPDLPGWFYEPTVLSDLTDDMRIVTEESFGPVASLYRVNDLDEAITIANQTEFGLSSSVWTNDAADEAAFISRIEAGAVFVNGMTVSFPELPFGGIKNSGYGRELGRHGIREFTNVKTVWKG